MLGFALAISSRTYAQDNWNGKKYSNNSAFQQLTARTVLQQVPIPSDATVLDLGCGAGNVTDYIASLAHEGSVLGVDASTSMITHAQKTYRFRKNLQFKTFTIGNSWPFSKEAYTHFVSFSCLHWIEDLQPTMRGIEQSLKPGGIFACCLAHSSKFNEPFYQVVLSDKWRHYFKNPQQKAFYCHDEESFGKLLSQVGLEPILLYTWNKKVVASRQEFIGNSKAWMPAITHMREVPQEKREEFMDDLIDATLEKTPNNSEGLYEVTSPILVVIARKDVKKEFEHSKL